MQPSREDNRAVAAILNREQCNRPGTTTAAAAAAADVEKDDVGGCGRAVGKDVRGGGDQFLYGVMVKKIRLCVFSILMFGKEAVCPDGLFVPAVFRESGFYLNSLKYANTQKNL